MNALTGWNTAVQPARIVDVNAAPLGDPAPPTSFPTTVRADVPSLFWALESLLIDTQDTWYWYYFQVAGAAGTGATADLTYPVPDPAPGFGATLRLEEVSRASLAHRTTIARNGQALLDQNWSGRKRIVFTAALPAGRLISGDNTVRVGALIDPTVTADEVLANYWEVDYRRLFAAWQGQLDFTAETAGTRDYLSQAWTTSSVSIWDVSTSTQPKRLTGAIATLNGSQYDIRFRATVAAGNRFWQQENLAAPASLRLRPATGLRNPAGGADAVIVTHASLRPAAETLAAWHRAHGRRVVIADIQDVYDEFNEGIVHPKAVPAMLAWAQTNWQSPAPAYLTLLGDGHFNFKDYNPSKYPIVPEMIPPYMAWVDPWQGQVPTDSLYGDITGDGLPDLAVGRLAVNNLAEATVVVNKIVSYDETARLQPWQQRAVFVADRYDPSAGDFQAMSDDIIANYLPADLTPVRVYHSSPANVAATKAGIVSRDQRRRPNGAMDRSRSDFGVVKRFGLDDGRCAVARQFRPTSGGHDFQLPGRQFHPS